MGNRFQEGPFGPELVEAAGPVVGPQLPGEQLIGWYRREAGEGGDPLSRSREFRHSTPAPATEEGAPPTAPPPSTSPTTPPAARAPATPPVRPARPGSTPTSSQRKRATRGRRAGATVPPMVHIAPEGGETDPVAEPRRSGRERQPVNRFAPGFAPQVRFHPKVTVQKYTGARSKEK